MAEGRGGWAGLGVTLLGKGVGSSGGGWVPLPPSGGRLSGGKSLPKFLTLVVKVFHFL